MQTRITITLLLALLVITACKAQDDGALTTVPPLPEDHSFGPPQRVVIEGYAGDAMEPFLSRDGRWLFFNDLNSKHRDTKLFFAERVHARHFRFGGEVLGVNTPALEAVASLDGAGRFYFISTRSYFDNRMTIYSGAFAAPQVTAVAAVPGMATSPVGQLIFDAEISADGETLYYAEGRFRGGPMPETADLAVAQREGDGFRVAPRSAEIFRALNTEALEYALALSPDELEIFFTRIYHLRSGPATVMLRATRPNKNAAFGAPQRISTVSGLTEAPTLAPDGRAIYYHRLEGGRYVLERVAR
ncbi:hypothetical protein BURK2_02361 [Burkholderiales bacterium]|nr:MAG: hypothetical protein F9K47_05050 [Burkholderiales bacterium]CAG0990562.1 hypothetical protein BURK2_02361 [Burkholderiales bacterium]